MMDSLRNAAKSWVAKLLIGLLAVSFGVWGIADVFRGYSRGSLASAGSIEITAQQFERAFNTYLQNLQRQTGQSLTPEEARKFGIDRAVLNNLLQSAAIDEQARSLKLAVSDAEIAKEIAENPAFRDSSGKFDPATFRRLLDANGMNEAMFFARERESRLRDAVTGSVDSGFVPSRTLIEAVYRHRNEQRDARYFVVATAESAVAAPTDDEIKKEYEAHPETYTAPEYRSIAIMKVEPADISSKISLSDQELAEGYDKYKTDYFTPEKRTILQLAFPSLDEAKKAKDRLAAGEDFLAIAKERGFTEADITFADKTKADFLDPAIADAGFALAEGAVSEPVKGGLSTVLLKAAKITAEHQRSLDEVKTELADRLKLDRARDEIQATHDAVEDGLAAQTKFEDIAATNGIPFQLVSGVDAAGKDRDGKEVAIPHKADVLKAAFDSDVGVENSALSLEDGYVWYEVREVVPSAIKPFDQVKDAARSNVVAAKVRQASLDKAKGLVERARNGVKLEDLAAEAGAEIKTAQALKRGEASGDFTVDAVKALFAVPDTGFAYALETDGKGARIMQSQPVMLPPFDPAVPDAKSVAAQLRTASAADLVGAYLGELQKSIGVQVNETLWRQISGTATQ